MTDNSLPDSPQPDPAGQREESAGVCASLDEQLKREEIALRRAERLCKEKELGSPVWLNPFTAALIAATLAALGNALVSATNSANQVKLEDRKAEQNRVLEMLKTGDPDKAAVNLEFLLSTGLVTDERTVSALREFLDDRKPGQGPTLTGAASGVAQSAFLTRIWQEREIPVCWEDPSASDAQDRALVQESIANTWEKASRINFIGWAKCADSTSGVRIAVADEPPHSKALGQFLRGVPNGVTLNFTFKTYSAACQAQRERCIVGISVHEFGHVLGFEHTQNRPDAPPECRGLAQGEWSGFVIGPYDRESVMNFCNPKWNNDGVLSDGDIAAVTALYGTRNETPVAGDKDPQ